MARTLSEFTGVYQVSETLTFELRPVGKTEENLKKSGLLEHDYKRADDYPGVKKFLDERHKQFLQDVLSQISDISWTPLADQIKAFQSNKDLKADLEKLQEKFRKAIVNKFTLDPVYAVLVKEATPSKLFAELLKSSACAPDEIKTFARFACYFKGYQENRRNIYSSDSQQTAAAYRAVNVNFTKFFSLVNIFGSLSVKYPDLLAAIKSRTAALLAGKELNDLLQIESYNQFLAQSGIDLLNRLICEINYEINQYHQQHPEIKAKELPFLPLLYKQILSDREQAFTIQAFENDTELCEALKGFVQSHHNAEINGCQVELFSSLQRELGALNKDSDLNIDAKALEKISTKMTGRWDTIQEAMVAFAVQKYKSKKEREEYCKRTVFHLSEINAWNICRQLDDDVVQAVDISAYWNGEYAAQLFEKERSLASSFASLISEDHKNLRDDEKKVQLLKAYLDTVQEIFHLLKPLAVSSEYGGDLSLLGILTAYYSKLEPIIPLYNQVRNYVVKKATDVPKIKLMFNKPTLADGWDNNKEKANLTVLFRKGNQFFLGIIAPDAHIDFEEYIDNSSEISYQKMVYKLLPGPNKMLPKVFFSKKNIDFFEPGDELLRRYGNGEHLKGDNFNLAFCHELIDFFKKSILRHEDWSRFDFQFSPTHSYCGIDEFYKEVAEQGYILNFVNIPEKTVDAMVAEGKLFLFKIWNKDFSDRSSGTPNKFTLFWQALFARENLTDVVFKLNGEAELFMRSAAIEKKVTHARDEKIINRTIVTEVMRFSDGKEKAVRQPLPENVHNELYLYFNGKKEKSELSSETCAYLARYDVLYWQTGMPIAAAKDKLIVKNAPFDIIKDKRFTEDKYSFHIPITINFKAPSKPAKFNEKVLNYLENNPDVKIIGLDRGERKLIYLTLIDQQGTILEQRSLNIINGVNYQEKLDLREKERLGARQSWREIGQIKDLKAGYLSGAVYEIVRMMIENNAIIVMEDLNFGFKRGRMKIEKQVYQNFERALIEKLNYLVFKDQEDHMAPGGVLAGFQLTGKFESFAKLGKQCGFIFYVPAGFTSKIDPATGFINVFDTKECTGAESIKAFFDKFDSIRYSAEHDAFAFSFDYEKFKHHQKDYQNKWTVFSISEAWHQERDKGSGKFSAIRRNPTAEIKAALEKKGLKLCDGFDLLSTLRTMETGNASAEFFKAIFYAFKLSVALRHSSKTEDKIISPVMNSDGKFFISEVRKGNPMPQDADANGAFHIALKGLYLLRNKIKKGKLEIITHDEWVKFVQTRNK